MFKRHWWHRRWTEGFEHTLHLGWDRVIQSWDMRFTDHDGAQTSFVVGQAWGVHGADRYLLAQIRARLGFTDTQKAVAALTAFRPDATAKLVERKANGAAVINTMRSRVGGLIPIEPEGGKAVRASAVEPFVEAGNVILPAAETIPCPPGYEPTSVDEFVEECAVFPNGAHDDQVDAMTQALNWLRSSVARTNPDDDDREPDTHPDLQPLDVNFATEQW